MIESVAKKNKIDRWDFGDFIENTKDEIKMGHSETFTYKELEEYAKEFKEYGATGK